MCGFVGSIGSARDLRIGLPWLARRGPDSQQSWRSRDSRVALLHARLAIVDVDARAHQPLTDDAAGVTVAFAGEIYNYEALRQQLADYPFRTRSDTEVILALYVREGVAGLRRMKGMFALAIVDESRQRVLLVRDAIGKKPLYVARWRGATLFGSSVMPLLAVQGAGAELDEAVLPHYWEHAFIPPTRGLVKGTRPLEPGELLELDWDGEVIRSERCEPAAELLYAGETATEARDNIGRLLREAVARRLHNNDQPTVLLSGGIDSTAVTAAAAALALAGAGGRPLQALTLGAVIPYTQDERYARFAARKIGVPLQVIRPRFADLPGRVIGALDAQDEPLGMVAYFLLHEMVAAASRHGRILLTGDGGDEVFLGYRPPEAWREEPRFDPATGEDVRVGPTPPAWMNAWARQVVGGTLLGHMFAKADRASAEQGVEIRCPLLDFDLLCYARSLPFGILAGDGRTKALLKEQLQGWPAWFTERPKLGFAFNLRWRWGLANFDGLREHVDPRAVATFAPLLPEALRGTPRGWTRRAIFRHFGEAWRLLAWSRFLARLDAVAQLP